MRRALRLRPSLADLSVVGGNRRRCRPPATKGRKLAVQDMYTRLLSANLDFNSELQHVFCWEPDECRDSRVFHVDRVFLRLC